MMKRVLFAHQSAIPHYRVPFYNTLERLRPDSWSFDVVFDPSEVERKLFFKETPDPSSFAFPILPVHTYAWRVRGKLVSYQTFWRKAATYDLLVIENAVNNLTYPLSLLHRLRGVKVAYWGHDRHIGAGSRPGPVKALLEKLKMRLVGYSDGFFAYTEEMRQRLIDKGLAPDKVFNVNNTIDIMLQRAAYLEHIGHREQFRAQMNVQDKRVLLFVGRFTANKRIDFLLEAFSRLLALHPCYHLLLVGGGGERYLAAALAQFRSNMSYLGPITELEKLGPIYTASDLFVFPGAIGLGPLQALCYDLPVVAIDSELHGPEVAYLNAANSVVLPRNTSVDEYVEVVHALFADPMRLEKLRASVWPSIQDLTVEQMALRFVDGIQTILGLSSPKID